MPQFDDTALVGSRWGRCARQRCVRFQKSAFRLYSLRVTCLPCLSERIGPRCLKSFKPDFRSEEHTSELQSLMRISYAVFCLKKKNQTTINIHYYRDKRT